MKLPSLILSFVAYVLAAVAYANAAPPTTQAGSQPQLWLDGWSAAGGVVVDPTPIPPDPAYIASGTDLAPLVTNAAADSTLNCDPKGTYLGNGTFGPKNAGVTVQLNGAKWNLKGAVGSGTNISVNADNFSILNGMLAGTDSTGNPTATVIIRTKGKNTKVDGCVFAKCGTGLQTDVGATGAVLSNSKITASLKVGAYFDQSGFTVQNCSIGKSDKEYGLRVTMPSSGTKPIGWQIIDTSIDNPRDATNTSKDGVGVREGDGIIKGLTCNNDIRIGQDPAAGTPVTPGQYCNLTISWCTFTNIPVGMYGVAIYQGSIVQLSNTSITAQDCVGVGKNSTLAAVDCTHVVPTGAPTKPFIAGSSQGKYQEVGTKTVQQ